MNQPFDRSPKRSAMGRALSFAIVLALPISSARAQVFDVGPSDSALFDKVINVPDSDFTSVLVGRGFGAPAGETTQLNLFDGADISTFTALPWGEVNVYGGFAGNHSEAKSGSEVNINGGNLGVSFDANDGSVVNISGGSLGYGFEANSGSEVNISGGEFGTFFTALEDSVVNVTGGTFGLGFEARSGSNVSFRGGTTSWGFDANAGSNVELVGGEFRLNGQAFLGSVFTLNPGDVFTGALADGSTFVFSSLSGDHLEGVSLIPVTLPTPVFTPIVVNTPITEAPSGLRPGQSLTVQAGGILDRNFAVIGATLNVEGGIVREGLEVSSGLVNIRSGTVLSYVGGRLEVFDGGVVDISGGSVGDNFNAHDGGVVNISGGRIGFQFDAKSGSRVEITGGSFGFDFDAKPGSEVNISGGNFAHRFGAEPGSDVKLIGGEFRLNRADFIGSTITLNSGDVLTGTLADGSAFIFARNDSDRLSEVTLVLEDLPAIDTSPVFLSSPVGDAPSGLREGQTLTVQAGGELGDNFAVVDATLNITGGIVGEDLELSGGVINISGGSVGEEFDVHSGGVLNVSGGTVGNFFAAHSGSEVNLFGTEFFLDGSRLDGLAAGEAMTINQRGSRLSGLLADGTPFSFDDMLHQFAADATLTITLVPEPSAAVLAVLAALWGIPRWNDARLPPPARRRRPRAPSPVL